MSTQKCPKHEHLRAEAFAILQEITELTSGQRAAFETGEDQRFMELDKQLELAVGRKERAIGALRQHTEEHGCDPFRLEEE
jgi:hypothetical protein